MDKLLIFPCGGTALEALDCVSGTYEVIGFVDDNKSNQAIFGYPVFGREAFSRFPEAKVLAVHGSPSNYLKREELFNSLSIEDSRLITAIHLSAQVSPLANIGKNVLIMAGVVVTSNAKIGNHVCILPNTVVHHDAEIGDYSLICSNVSLAGNVKIGRNCYVGSGAKIIQGVSVGAGALVGMGSVVLCNVDSATKVVGNPARKIS